MRAARRVWEGFKPLSASLPNRQQVRGLPFLGQWKLHRSQGLAVRRQIEVRNDVVSLRRLLDRILTVACEPPPDVQGPFHPARRALAGLGQFAAGQLTVVGSDLSECGRRVGRRHDIWMLIGGRPLPHALRAERSKRMDQDDDPNRVAHRTLHVAAMMIAGLRLRYERTT